MQKISDFLDKFKNFGKKEREEKEKILKVVNKVLKLNLKREDVEIKDLKLKIKVSGVPRTEIILNKNKILSDINSEIDNKIIDIN